MTDSPTAATPDATSGDPELDRLRQESRVRAGMNSYAQGLLKNLTNSVIGKGYTYKAAGLSDDGKPLAEERLSDGGKQLVRSVQEVIDRFLKANHWNCSIDPRDTTALAATREREAFRQVLVDGEAFVRFHRADDGTVKVRLIDPARVRDGSGYTPQLGWSYGIRHEMEPFEDVETPTRYAVFWPDASATGGIDGQDHGVWEEIPAEEVLHLKGPDTPGNVKRGRPLLTFDLGRALDRAAKLQTCASAGAAYRAAIAETWQYEQATQGQITSMAAALASRTHTDGDGHTEQLERVRPGTVRRGPTGAELVQPSADNTASYLSGVQGDLQQACAGAGVPSFAIGDVSSGNYSNYESASFPPVLNAVCEQEYYKAAFARAVWHAVMWAAECGLLPKDVADKVTITVEAPAVLHRNELEKAQEDHSLITDGVKDRQTAAAERGLDWKQVSANNTEYSKAQQALAPQPPPGEDGQPGKGKPPAGGGGGGKPPAFPRLA